MRRVLATLLLAAAVHPAAALPSGALYRGLKVFVLHDCRWNDPAPFECAQVWLVVPAPLLDDYFLGRPGTVPVDPGEVDGSSPVDFTKPWVMIEHVRRSTALPEDAELPERVCLTVQNAADIGVTIFGLRSNQARAHVNAACGSHDYEVTWSFTLLSRDRADDAAVTQSEGDQVAMTMHGRGTTHVEALHTSLCIDGRCMTFDASGDRAGLVEGTYLPPYTSARYYEADDVAVARQ
ncbi:MAG TPA: hypothetical protein VGB83_12635 [Actinomycetota bacterium]